MGSRKYEPGTKPSRLRRTRIEKPHTWTLPTKKGNVQWQKAMYGAFLFAIHILFAYINVKNPGPGSVLMAVPPVRLRRTRI